MMYLEETSTRFCPGMTPSRNPLWEGGGIRLGRKGLIGFLLLLGVLSIAGLAKASPYCPHSTLTRRMLRHNRIAEPSPEQAEVSLSVALPIAGHNLPAPPATTPAYPASDRPVPLLTLDRSPAQLRSPPNLE